MKKCKHKLNMLTSTWSKESNELFDYESPELFKQEFSVDTAGSVTRNKNQISFNIRNLNDTIAPIQNEPLFSLDCTTSQFYMNANKSNEQKESTWITLRGFQSKKYQNSYSISVGDLVKFGRIAMKIREIQLEGKSKGNIFDIYKECTKPNLFMNSKMTHNRHRICRICYCDEFEVESPLINPCKCSGGLKYIHLSCLQHWLKSKAVIVTTSNENCTAFTFTQIECELCKQVFPDFIKIDSTYYQIFDFSQIKYKTYISFETLPINGKKTVYVVSFDKKNTIKIGRSHESDLRITDVTVSRFHAQITRTYDDLFSLMDTTSKFGTLIYLHLNKVPLFRDIPFPIQIGRTFIQMWMSTNRNICNCFGLIAIHKDKSEDYCDMNANEIIIDKMLSVKVQLMDEDDDDSEEEKIEEKKDIKEMLPHLSGERNEENNMNYASNNHLNEDRNRSLINIGLYSNHRSSGINNNNTNISIE